MEKQYLISIIIHTPSNINNVIKCRTVIWTGHVTGYKILAKDIKWEESHGRQVNVGDSIKVNIRKIICASFGQM
jgi:NADH dehydrogenase FAD-containing subunit